MARYCTDCGNLTTQQKNNLFVCTEGHENFLDPSPAAVTYILNGDQVLFGYRSIEPHKGGLNIAGGFMEPGESAEEATLREVKEEFNIDVDIIGYLRSYGVDYANSNKPVLCIVFIARYKGDTIIPGDDMSGGEPVWRSIYNLPTADELAWKWQLEAQKDLLTWFKLQE